MSSIKQKLVQFGDGPTYGTGTAGAIQIPGVQYDSVTNFHTAAVEEQRDEARGVLGGDDSIDVISKSVTDAGFTLKPTYEHLPYILDMLDEATPAGGDPYTYNYVEPTTSQPDPRYTSILIDADGTNVPRRLISAYLRTLNISWTNETRVEMSPVFGGYDIEAQALASLSNQTGWTNIWGSHANIFIDAVGGSTGTTPVYCVYSGSLDIDTQAERCPLAGSLQWGEPQYPKGYMTTGAMSIGLDATLAGYLSTTAAVKKLVRIQFVGGGDLDYTIDFTAWLKAPDTNPYSDQNGIATMDLAIQVVGGSLDMTVTNNTASLYA